jgi:hypothetical protein
VTGNTSRFWCSHRLKIQAAVRNARAFLKVQEEFGDFDSYCWRFVGGRPKLNRWKAARQISATSPESETFSKDLKHRGFSFVGPTVVYAFMQAVGMVNDHLVDCFRYREILREIDRNESGRWQRQARVRQRVPLAAWSELALPTQTRPCNCLIRAMVRLAIASSATIRGIAASAVPSLRMISSTRSMAS